MYVSKKLLMNDMEKAVAVACHEISHQVGSKARLREERYDKITNTIAYLLLHYGVTALPEDDNQQYFKNVVSILSSELSQCWKEQYKSSKKDFYLKTIREFIDATHTFTKMQITSGNEISDLDKMICERWSAAISKMDSKLRDYICSSLNNYYNTSLFDDSHNDFDCIAQILYNSFSNYCESISETVALLNEHTEYCDIVIQAFSESYSDLQMIKFGNIADFSEYKDTLQFVSDDMNSIEDTLRINAIRNILSYDKIEEMDFTFEGGNDRDFVAIRNICEYLIECKKISNDDIKILPFEENGWLQKTPTYFYC